MKRIIIEGGHKLTGTIKIGGAKNSVVALLPAALLSDEGAYIRKVPNISDKDALVQIMTLLGADVEVTKTTVKVNSSKVKSIAIPEELSNKLRASYYFMGVLLARYKKVQIHFPGGCKIGERPIDYHLKGFEKLGAKIKKDDSKYTLTARKLVGCPINLEFASVGATINIMFAATRAEGITTINNAAREAEIINVADFLNSMGAKISGQGTSTITIEGVKYLKKGSTAVIPDRIEAGTYVVAGALLGKNLKIEGIEKNHIGALLKKLDDMGIPYDLNKDSITISKVRKIKPINVKTLVFPGFPTDLGQPIQVLLTQASGASFFEETIYENRMAHIKYLQMMNANIEHTNMRAKIVGPTKLVGREITAQDLRGGAALVLAGLIAEGLTIVNDADHILRGYERIIEKLTNVGAKIKIE